MKHKNILEAKIKLNSCNSCPGICCYNPPVLSSEEEIKTAQKYNAKLIAIQTFPKHYLVAVTKNEQDKCPFLDKDGKCSIYEERFETCRNYSCQLLKEEKSAISLFDDLSWLNNKSAATHPVFFSKEILENYNIPIENDYHKAMNQIYGLNISTFIGLLGMLIDNAKASGEFK